VPKLKLDFQFDIDFDIVGIITSLQDYKVCHFLNESLKMQMKRIQDREIIHPKRDTCQYFKQYYFKDELNKLEYYLISNKNQGERCLPEMKIVDYLLLINGNAKQELVEEMMGQIKSLSGIASVLRIRPEQINSIENIIIDECNF